MKIVAHPLIMANKLVILKKKVFEQELAKLDVELQADAPDPAMIDFQMKTILTKYTCLEEAVGKFQEELLAANNDDDYLKMEDQMTKFHFQYDAAERKAKSFFNGSAEKVDHNMKLPKLKLQEFSGDIRNWLSFWAGFQEINNNTSLTDNDKFQYLLQCIPVSSLARKTVDGFPVSGKIYRSAVDALKAIYGKETTLVKVYMRDLLQLAIRNANEKTRMDLMELVPLLVSQIRNLEQLGVTSDKCEMVLYPVVESCLPDDVMQAWQRHTGYAEKLNSIIDFLNSEVQNKMERSLAKMEFTSPAVPERKGSKQQKYHDVPTASMLMVTGSDNEKIRRCIFCDGRKHNSRKCRNALKLPFKERQDIVRKHHLCFLCLKAGHRVGDCQEKHSCSNCGGNHCEAMCRVGGLTESEPKKNIMMITQPDQQSCSQCCSHQNKNVSRSTADKEDTITSSSTALTTLSGKNKIALETIVVKIDTPEGFKQARVFIDEGSEESYVIKRVIDKVGSYCEDVGSRTMCHQVFTGAMTKATTHKRYKITICSLDGNKSDTFVFNSLPKIAQGIAKPPEGPWIQELFNCGITIPDQSAVTEEVHLLFGMDIAAKIWTGKFKRINPGLVAKETKFGWVVGGSTGTPESPIAVTSSHMVTSFMIANLNEEDLWSLDTIGITDESKSQTRADLEEASMKFFESTVQIEDDGRYQVRLPWLQGHRKLSSNKSQAIARLNGTTRALKADGCLNNYDEIIHDWCQQGIVEKVPPGEENKAEYFLPHRHIVKPQSTTPVRPVFDASAKAKGSPSLNDSLEKGPNMLELIPAVMSRFRMKKVGAVADVKKAFLQLSVNPQDRPALQFMWWKDLSCSEIQVFRHRRVVFGVKPSPFLLAASLQHLVKSNSNVYPDTALPLFSSFYVDNSVSSHDNFDDAMKFKEEAVAILSSAKMDLRGWEFGPSHESKQIPVLGMEWSTSQDTISFNLENTMIKLNAPLTKRGLLSAVHSVYDPMGFVAPFTVVSKLLFQKCCMLELKWDDPLPSEISTAFIKWKLQVPKLQKIMIPRWMCQGENTKISLHVFSDASFSAFASACFIRTETVSGSATVQLVMCRSRVAPLKKKVTIPRLELLGCLIGVRLAKDVKKYLGDLDIPCLYWSDSSTALAWIKNEKPWARFVQARVDEIRSCSKTDEWRFVPGEQNPADLPSRGCSVARLIQLQWWESPAWLAMSEDTWPKASDQFIEDEVNSEAKKTVVSSSVQVDSSLLGSFSKFESFHTILRIVSIILRYMDRLKARVKARKMTKFQELQLIKSCLEKMTIDESTAEEVERAEICILKIIQTNSFNGNEDPRLKKLETFIDEQGVIRTKSQLYFGDDNFDVRCPIVLPANNDLVKTLIRTEHVTNNHAGVQTTLAILRNRYWIVKCRRTVSSIIGKCPQCRKYSAPRCSVPGAPLPKNRIKDTVAFDVTGVDLMGPLYLRGGEKIWIVLFTCAVYRCVHLEITTTLSTDGFIRAFRRFVARRGRPRQMYSDNGLNFVGCVNLFRSLDMEEVRRYAAVQRMEWTFNPPTAAWWGGWWERLVGLTKRLLRRILGKRVVDSEEFTTILCDVESTLNQRPLTYITENDTIVPLCPAYFMRDNPFEGLPEADTVDAEALQTTAKRCQVLREALRTRFRKEYLGYLQHHAGTKHLCVKKGDVVLIEVDDKKRNDWPWGVVKAVYPGRDGKERTALVATGKSEFLRPIQRLYLLEAALDDHGKTEETVQFSRFGRKIKKPILFS